jgi:D-ribulokinase
VHQGSPDAVWVGVDIGTQGVRALAVTADGGVAGRGTATLTGERHDGRHEQNPEDWWTAVRQATRAALAGVPPAAVRALAVCSTSGTLLLTDPAVGTPLTPGIMYDDGRAAGGAQWARELENRLGHRVQPTWALAKARWLAQRRPGGLGTARITHQADFVVSRLTGGPVPTDSSHALKTGYDLHRDAWPHDLLDGLGLPPEAFPDVVRPGAVLGEVCAAAAELTGLPAGTRVIAGMTDGCAAQLGSGALRPGGWNSVLGTTLVLKGVTTRPLRDPAGVIYSHRAPDGGWLPGGASSVGAGVLAGSADLAALDAMAARHEPSQAVAYPLVSPGERFPFLAPQATAFMLGTPVDEGDRHAALLQGVGLIERLALAYIRQLGGPVEGPLTFTGGATRSAYWCRLRADILGRQARIPEQADGALGMAVLAAYGTSGGAPLAEIAESMVRIRTVIDPSPGGAERFAEPFVRLVNELERRGWLPAEAAAHARDHG